MLGFSAKTNQVHIIDACGRRELLPVGIVRDCECAPYGRPTPAHEGDEREVRLVLQHEDSARLIRPFLMFGRVSQTQSPTFFSSRSLAHPSAF